VNIKKVGLERRHVPNFSFESEDEKGATVVIKNRDLTVDDQVVVSIKLATEVNLSSYNNTFQTYDKNTKQLKHYTSPQTEHVVSKHLLSIDNLSYNGEKITTAIALIQKAKNEISLSQIVLDCYNAICAHELYLCEPGKKASKVDEEDTFLGE